MLLKVKGLKAYYITPPRVIRAVDGVEFSLAEGETLGLAGESGCGKSTIGYSIMGVLPSPGQIVAGSIEFRGLDLIKSAQNVRGKEIALVFQGAMNALNPVLTVGRQIDEVLLFHLKLPRKERRERITSLLEMVQLEPKLRVDYPHQLSGGMKQRLMIAMALACNPRILIADEPTTNLDMITQKKIIDLLNDLKERLGLSIIFISHDLALISQSCERVAILEQGKIIESGATIELFSHPTHPTTQRLIDSLLKLRKEGQHASQNGRRQQII
jgi:ABC-type dipeptide/oligopeptide/nickel transport system ATPase component